MRRLLLFALLASLTPWVSAQRISAGSHFARSGFRGGHPRAFLDPLAFYDYSGLLSASDYSPPAPPVIVVQPPPPSTPVSEHTSAPAEPLLIELQGDRYVRVSDFETSQPEMIDRTPPSPPERNSFRALAAQPAAAVIVFRDGHREEISNYTISGGFLYVATDYYSSGSWNRRIELSSLNLSGTVASNQARGINFRLPASPNEVIVGP